MRWQHHTENPSPHQVAQQRRVFILVFLASALAALLYCWPFFADGLAGAELAWVNQRFGIAAILAVAAMCCIAWRFWRASKRGPAER